MKSDKPDTADGGCACGRVRLHVTGTPVRVGLCHCLDCRKAHAAAFSTFVIFPANNVEIQSGGDSTLGRFDRGDYSRYFCRDCGVHVYAQSAGSSEIELFLGSFDEPNLWSPTYEAWVKRRENWLGTLPTITGHFSEDAKLE